MHFSLFPRLVFCDSLQSCAFYPSLILGNLSSSGIFLPVHFFTPFGTSFSLEHFYLDSPKPSFYSALLSSRKMFHLIFHVTKVSSVSFLGFIPSVEYSVLSTKYLMPKYLYFFLRLPDSILSVLSPFCVYLLSQFCPAISLTFDLVCGVFVAIKCLVISALGTSSMITSNVTGQRSGLGEHLS